MFPTLQTAWLFNRAERSADGRWSFFNHFDYVRVSGDSYDAEARLVFGVRGVRGRVELRIVFTDLETGDALTVRSLNLQGEPLETVVVPFRLDGMPVPHAGTYAWELYCGGQLLGGVRLVAEVEGPSDA